MCATSYAIAINCKYVNLKFEIESLFINSLIKVIMKTYSPTIVCISLAVILFFVTIFTLLSSNQIPEKNDAIALLVTDNG